ncbi:ATP synthase F1 subunit delta [Marinoscillum sp. MHG1-6]|uniref:ATP synthase F1 subunit delta n=1 Tax=Marinoscillum sp. MHG1-6 TaxID=2959627 RepID=UPI002158678E|nr:ATP synthase F1 subunit delta [Marinoscillum sp. MHG1-6]
MSTTKIAIRYAKPLLELAEEQGKLENVFSDINGFLAICKSNRDFILMLKSPIIPHLKKADILDKIFKGKVTDLTASFLQIIARKNRESLLPDIASKFIQLYNNKKGIQEAVVTTSVAIDAKTRKAFEKLIADVTGKKPSIVEKVDPEIIGGFVVKLGDQQIDDSIKGKLKDLELKFQKEKV